MVGRKLVEPYKIYDYRLRKQTPPKQFTTYLKQRGLLPTSAFAELGEAT